MGVVFLCRVSDDNYIVPPAGSAIRLTNREQVRSGVPTRNRFMGFSIRLNHKRSMPAQFRAVIVTDTVCHQNFAARV